MQTISLEEGCLIPDPKNINALIMLVEDYKGEGRGLYKQGP